MGLVTGSGRSTHRIENKSEHKRTNVFLKFAHDMKEQLRSRLNAVTYVETVCYLLSVSRGHMLPVYCYLLNSQLCRHSISYLLILVSTRLIEVLDR